MQRESRSTMTNAGRPRRPLSRGFRFEKLESRALMANDLAIGMSAVQNEADPFDVDISGWPTPMDALLIVNHLNGVPVADAALDVNGDGAISRLDFDNEIARLNVGTPEASETPLWLGDGSGDSGGIAGGKSGGSGGTSTYKYYYVGSSTDCSDCAPTAGGLALVGGGTDVDEVFRWMGAKADGGDFLVLAASGTGAYNSYIKTLVPTLNSVATLIIPDGASANDPFVADKIRNAEAIFFSGGDQAAYVNFWSNTPVESALYDAIARNAPVGGTSAGLAILGDYDFSAVNGTITSSDALANPYDSRISLDGRFVNERDYVTNEGGASALAFLNDATTDSHFQQRDRMGRLVTFLARLDADGKVPDAGARGIAVNEQTALLVDADGVSRVVGNPYSKKLPVAQQQRSVYFLDASTIATAPLGTPLVYSNVQVVRASYDPKLNKSDSFDLSTWTGAGVAYWVSAANGGLTSTQAGGAIY